MFKARTRASLLTSQVGLVASVGFSLILVIQRSTTPRIKIIGRRPNSDEWVAIDEDDEAREEMPGVVSNRLGTTTYTH